MVSPSNKEPMLKLNEQQQKNVKNYLNMVWNDIASDVLDASDGEMDQASVIDVVLDQACGAQYPASGRITKEAIEDVKLFFKEFTLEDQEKFAKTVFNYRLYGR